ncbi:MAG: DUF3276 family protein [Prolixibacteraceae bacterium]|jgi:hypothetical protein|nr:DUF3276 family protein [Prolixibacteraceae bacterium]
MEAFNTNRNDSSQKKENIQEIFSRGVKAGNRTYFFDVRKTKRDEYYLSITESKKRFKNNGEAIFEKHKIFLYREDFHKWVDALNETLSFIEEQQPLVGEDCDPELVTAEFSNIEFDDI